MNDNESILAELRRIAAWADMQRKMTKWSLIVVAIFIPAIIVFGVWMEHRSKTEIEDLGAAGKPDWYDVDRNTRLGDFAKAIQAGEELTRKTPQHPEAHRRLAAVYLAAGRIDKAREHYAEAFRLFPSEENERLLVAIDKRIKAEAPNDAAANGSQPVRPETNRTTSAAGSRR
jgi:tetratricopeptide (TPR) repeat protein